MIVLLLVPIDPSCFKVMKKTYTHPYKYLKKKSNPHHQGTVAMLNHLADLAVLPNPPIAYPSQGFS